MLIPDFTENRDDSVVMYFAVDGSASELEDEIEKTYFCYVSMQRVNRDGKEYIAVVVDDLNE